MNIESIQKISWWYLVTLLFTCFKLSFFILPAKKYKIRAIKSYMTMKSTPIFVIVSIIFSLLQAEATRLLPIEAKHSNLALVTFLIFLTLSILQDMTLLYFGKIRLSLSIRTISTFCSIIIAIVYFKIDTVAGICWLPNTIWVIFDFLSLVTFYTLYKSNMRSYLSDEFLYDKVDSITRDDFLIYYSSDTN